MAKQNLSRWPEWQTSLGLKDNHGQWNEVWGTYDTGGSRGDRILDVRGLIDPEDQREFARALHAAQHLPRVGLTAQDNDGKVNTQNGCQGGRRQTMLSH